RSCASGTTRASRSSGYAALAVSVCGSTATSTGRATGREAPSWSVLPGTSEQPEVVTRVDEESVRHLQGPPQRQVIETVRWRDQQRHDRRVGGDGADLSRTR